MILDTNALSAWADGDPAIEPLLPTATRYAEWLAVNLDTVDVARIDRAIAAVARHERLPIISRDGHFDAVRGVERVSW